jgi:hypothetical protein
MTAVPQVAQVPLFGPAALRRLFADPVAAPRTARTKLEKPQSLTSTHSALPSWAALQHGQTFDGEDAAATGAATDARLKASATNARYKCSPKERVRKPDFVAAGFSPPRVVSTTWRPEGRRYKSPPKERVSKPDFVAAGFSPPRVASTTWRPEGRRYVSTNDMAT